VHKLDRAIDKVVRANLFSGDAAAAVAALSVPDRVQIRYGDSLTGPIDEAAFKEKMQRAGCNFSPRYGPWWDKQYCSLRLEMNKAQQLVLHVIPPAVVYEDEDKVKPCRVRAGGSIEILHPTWEDLRKILDLFELVDLLETPADATTEKDGAAPVT